MYQPLILRSQSNIRKVLIYSLLYDLTHLPTFCFKNGLVLNYVALFSVDATGFVLQTMEYGLVPVYYNQVDHIVLHEEYAIGVLLEHLN
jgi:hypothetical protein